LRTAIGKITFDELNSSKDSISKAVKKDIKKTLKNWGVTLSGVDIMKLKPLNSRVKQALTSQNTAEQNQKQIEKNADAAKMVKENKAKADK